MTIHLYQLYSIAILKDLKKFFKKSPNNSIDFQDCLGSVKWSLYLLVDKESKYLKINPILSSKSSWEFSRKEECDSIMYKWQIYFQASEYKGRNFLKLNNDDNTLIYSTYTKGKAWLKHFGSSLCACITRLVTDHAPISEYKLRFFSKESIACLCGNYPIEMRRYILFECLQYKKSWNLKRELLQDILTFLEFNLEAFCFQKDIT